MVRNLSFIYKKFSSPFAKAIIQDISAFISRLFSYLSCNFLNHRVFFRFFFKKTIVFFLALQFIIFEVTPYQTQEINGQNEGEIQKISLDVKNMDIIDVLKILADKGNFNLSISERVRGRITLFLKDVSVGDALEIVLASGNLAYEIKGNIINVMTERDYELKYGRKYWDTRETKVFNLQYAKPSKVKEFLTQVASKVGKVIIDESTGTLVVMDIPEKIREMVEIIRKVDKPLKIKVIKLNYLPVEKVEQKIEQMLTQDVGIAKIDEATNKIIVVDYPEKVEEVERMIKAFDEKPLQVLIDAKIIEIKPFKKFYAGINWDYWIEKYFRIAGSFSMPSPENTTEKLSFGTIGIGDVSQKGDYSAIIDFLQNFGETNVLSTPRILALNNQEAKILVGTKEVYITSTVSQSGTGTAITSQSVNFVDVGVKLYVTPTINRQGYITMKIKPEISSAERVTLQSEGTSTDVPIVTTTEAETSVIVKDGVSIFIGGLKKIEKADTKKQIPFLGNIPGLGVFFRNTKKEWSKNELVIILTPKIVSGDKSIEMEIKEKMDEEERIEEFSYSGTFGLPEKSSKRQEYDIGYYKQITERIRKTAAFFKGEEKGRLKVRFVISRNGELLGEPKIVSSNDASGYLRTLVKEIIKKSAPFPTLPYSNVKGEATFEVVLIF